MQIKQFVFRPNLSSQERDGNANNGNDDDAKRNPFSLLVN